MIRIIHVVFNIFYYYYHCNDYAQLYIYICVHSHNMSLNHSCELWGLFFSRFSNQVVVQVVVLFSKCRFRRFLLVCLDLRIDVLSKCRALLKTPVASEASPRKNVVVTGGCPNIWQRMNNMPTGGFHDYGYPWLPMATPVIIQVRTGWDFTISWALLDISWVKAACCSGLRFLFWKGARSSATLPTSWPISWWSSCGQRQEQSFP